MSDIRHNLRRLTTPNRFVLLGVSGLVIVGGLLTYQIVRAEGRILPNVTVGGINLGNLSPESARDRLTDALRALNLTGIEFIHEDRSYTVKANEVRATSDAHSIITYDIDAMVEDAYLAGGESGRTGFIMANIQALFTTIDLPAKYAVDRATLESYLKTQFGDLEHPAKDAEVSVVSDGDSGFRVVVSPERVGTAIDYDSAIETAHAALGRWQGGTITLVMVRDIPKITENKAELMAKSLLDANVRGKVVFGFDDRLWEISGPAFTEALTLKAHPDGSLYVGLKDKTVSVVFDEAAKVIEQKPRGTRLVLNEESTRAVEFQGGQVGRALNRSASVSLAEERLTIEDDAVIPLVVDLTPAPDSDALAEEYGIRELIGWGTSDFSGSPANRRLNIKNGMERLDGWLIAPGEEFGLLEKLRPFDASGGYVQELVIKGNRTIREYGGGLCQIGTTSFRAVMGAGLPITERQNHSYSVSYYAPAGTDATLYDPAPDFKFVNDTKDHVLFATHMYGDILRFEFWGTRDGRVQERSEIRTWGHRSAPEPRLIPTSALAPGVKRCFEIGHAGLSTAFDYSITYADGKKDTQTFTSVYKPWQSQCLIGEAGAPNIKLEWDGSLREYPTEGGPVTIQVVPEDNQCTVGGCPG